MRRLVAGLLIAVAASTPPAAAQTPASTARQGSAPAAATAPQPDAVLPQPLTLAAALQYASDHYPAVRAAIEQVDAAAAGTRLARTAYLPRLDSLWQTNRASVNNVTGLLLPQSIVPGISGPPLASESSASAWGSAAGALFSWEPFDMGLRGAGVRDAEAAVARARADEALTRLDVQAAVATAFLAVVHADQAVTAARADVERRNTLARTARTLADNQLRPGAEASRADAERAAADTRLILARQALAVARASLTRTLGATVPAPDLDAAPLLAPAPQAPPASAAGTHPLLQARQASVDAARTREEVLAASNRPRLYLQSAAFARGSGATANGSLDGGASGLGLSRGNWAAGVQVVIPDAFSFPALRARRASAAAATRAEGARLDEAMLTVTAERQAAAAMVEAADAVAVNTPRQVAAARLSEAQATARYQAGLGTLAEVADAQALLAQAEYQDAGARVDVWRALLAEGVARGDLGAFIRLAGAGGAR
jgi:outer membrane protein TolC